MFSGIVHNCYPVTTVRKGAGQTSLGVRIEHSLAAGLEVGASVAIAGVCLTAVAIEPGEQGAEVQFDAMGETLARTTLGQVAVGGLVNVERSLKFGDEVGGHLVSGHVFGMAEIKAIENPPGNHVVTLAVPPDWTRYLLPKGFVALDGVSLTVVDVNRSAGTFSVWLIPETLRRTTFGSKQPGDRVNLELDSQTQTIVDTLARLQNVSQ